MLAVVCKRMQQLPITTQQHATGCVNGRNMKHPTVLEVLANNVDSVCTGLKTRTERAVSRNL